MRSIIWDFKAETPTTLKTARALMTVERRYDITGHPVQVSVTLQEEAGKARQEMAVCLDTDLDVGGYVDARQLIGVLRTVANVIEKELA